MSGTRHSTGGQDVEGRWLQLMHCAYPLVVSLYFGYAGNLGIDFRGITGSNKVYRDRSVESE